MKTHNCSNSIFRKASAILLGLLFGLYTVTTYAVDDLGVFELEGNAVDNSGAAAPDDWNTDPDDANGSAFEFTGINADPAPVTIFTGGRKDIQLISDWGHKNGSVPDKDDITNAYAAAYNVANELIVYFGADRFANVGDAFMGFWFFKDKVVAEMDGSFSGAHMIGDVLVLVEYPQGANEMPILKVILWDPSCPKAANNNPQPGDCAAKNLFLQASFASAECGAGGDDVCAITNSGNETAPWAYTPKSGTAGTFPPESFYEGGINLTQVVGNTCFSSFMAESRSSKSFTASLKDFVLDEFELCGMEAAKTCPALPVVDTDGLSFISKYNVTISNTGFAPVFDPVIREDITYQFISGSATPSNSEVCAITKVGGSAVTPVPLPSGDLDVFVAVPGVNSIASNSSLVVELTCDVARNPFVNQVTAGVSSVDNTAADLFDVGLVVLSTSEPCAATPVPGLTVTKQCNDVRLMAMNGVLAVEVLVDITVENTGDEQLQLVTVTDTDLGDLSSFVPGGILAVGQKITIPTQSYMPTAPDQGPISGTSDKYDPDTAMFSDTVDADGQGTLSQQAVDATDVTVTCDLCPQPDP